MHVYAPSRSGYLIVMDKSFTIIEETYRPIAPATAELRNNERMYTFFFFLLAEQPPGPPLIGNNLVFYSVVGGALLLVLLPLVLWLRRRTKQTESDNLTRGS
jgi:hypothetical protein